MRCARRGREPAARGIWERIAELERCAGDEDSSSGEVATPHYRELQQKALDVERQMIIRLRNEHVINDDALRRIQRDLDLAEARLSGE
jgi:monovalent cation/hydrogen antiporter